MTNAFSPVLTLFIGLLLFQFAAADYIGAVVEHTTYEGTASESPSSKLNKNIELYEGLTALAAKHGVQMLVFPEFGLTPGPASQRSDLYPYMEKIPESSAGVIPCGDSSFFDRPILQQMSCAAKNNKQLLLVDMIDNVPCSSESDSRCPSDGHYQHNTAVIFNTEGKIVTKYHKSHEIQGLQDVGYDIPAKPSQVTYLSDFGVEFGVFICFDIMFNDPPKVLRERGVQHFLYPVQQGNIGEKTIIEGWSKQNNATVLSANLGSGKKDCSGLIVNGTPLNAKKVYLDSKEFPEENLLIATVPHK